MKKIIRYTLASALLMLSGSVSAQNLNSAYFLDGYANGHELNPAKDYDRKSYFSMPFFGNLNVGLRGNLGLKDLIMKHPNDPNKLVTFMHPDLSVDEALKGIKDNNKFVQDMRFDLLSFGFHSKHAYQTFNLTVRENLGLNVPGDMFRMVRELKNQNYDFSNIGFRADAWAEMAWGYSRDVNKAIRVGGKLKLLMGAGYADMKLNSLKLDLQNPNEWTVEADANAEVGVKGFTWGETETKEYNVQKPGHTTYQQINLDNVDVDGGGLAGMGMAVDLGAEWDLGQQDWVEGLKVSASVLDLGFIKYNNVATAHNRGDVFKFNGFNDIKIKDGEGVSMDDQLDDLGDRFSDLVSLQDGGTISKTRNIGATMNIGVEYQLPQYDRLSFGALSTVHFGGVYKWNEERISATISPVNWLEGSANFVFGTFGTGMGWVVNLHPKGFGLFMGGDYILGKVSKQGIPLHSRANISMGINFPLGKVQKK